MEANGGTTEARPGAQHAALHGVLALLVDARESRIAGDKSATKTEILLDRAGLTVDDIARVMGKNRDAVRKAISRGKAA